MNRSGVINNSYEEYTEDVRSPEDAFFTHEMLRSAHKLVRSRLYGNMKLEPGRKTYSDIEYSLSDGLAKIRRALEKQFRFIVAAQNQWCSDGLIMEVLRRNKVYGKEDVNPNARNTGSRECRDTRAAEPQNEPSNPVASSKKQCASGTVNSISSSDNSDQDDIVKGTGASAGRGDSICNTERSSGRVSVHETESCDIEEIQKEEALEIYL